MRIPLLLLSLALGASHAGAVHVQRLSFDTHDGAAQPSVTADPRGGFILTWQERAASDSSLWYAAIDRDGRETRRGRIASGDGWSINWANFPSLAVLANGDWVTHYFVKGAASSPHASDIRIVRSTDQGATWSEPIAPHTDGTESEHGFVSLVGLQGDRVLAIWLDGRHTVGAHHGKMTLRSAILDRSGKLAEEREIDDSTCDCCQTDAARAGGHTLIVYRDRSRDEVRDISVIERSDQGAWSTPRTVHADGWTIEGCPVNGPAIAVNGARVLTVWPTQAGGIAEVRYTLGSANAPGPARKLATGAGTLGRVDAAVWGDGFLATWLGDAGGKAGLQLARIDSRGRVLTRQTVASVDSTRMSGNPRLASTGERALLAWMEPDSAKPGQAVAIALVKGERQR